MPIDTKQFRQTAGRFLTGVTVITCDIEGEVQGMTANSFTSVSLDPPLVLFCPGKSTRTGRNVNKIEHFSVNVLREEQQALSSYFAGGWTQPVPPPFRFVLHDGVPRLEGSLASLICRVHGVNDAGDHWIVLGEVIGLHQGLEPLRPLGFHMGRYAQLEIGKTTSAPDLYKAHDPSPVHYHYESW